MSIYHKCSDYDLFELFTKGDDRAFAEIYERYKGPLFMHSYRILENEEEAKDVLQELFTALWSKREQIHLQSSLSAYLYSATRNRVLDLIAHRQVKQRYIDSLSDFISSGTCITEEHLREKELASMIEKEVSLLPERMRLIFELSRNHDRSYKEIAEELNISDKTVKKQVSYALKILRERLDLTLIISLIMEIL